MARSRFGFELLPVLGLTLACAKAVDQGFVADDDDDSGGGQAGSLGGQANAGGRSAAGGGQINVAGKTAAFGGTSSSAGGSAADGGGGTDGGSPTGGKGGAGGGSGSASGGAAGTGTAGGNGGAGGKAGGSGGSSGGGDKGGAGAGGSAGAAGSSGNGGSGGSGTNNGECAKPGSGWVVQYWTNTGAANMPAGDVRIFNDSAGSVNFDKLELRHYFTNEETASLSFIFSTFSHNFPGAPYYEDEGGANVLNSIVNLTPAVANASQYISIKFNDNPGSFANGENVQLGYYGSLSMYPLKSNQANDYTYISHPQNDPGSANKNAGWDHITLYAAGKLVWGCEP